MILPMIASIFLIIAIVCFLNLTPQQITQDLSSVVSKKPNIRDRARALRAGKKKTGPGAKLEYLQSALKACGKEGMFAFVCSSALVLFAVGAVVAILINNVFLIPALSVSKFLRKTADEYVLCSSNASMYLNLEYSSIAVY